MIDAPNSRSSLAQSACRTASDAQSQLDVASLTAAAAEGDLRATQTFLELLAPAMYRAVRSVLGPQHPDTDDVVQQSLISLVQSLPRFRGECQPSTYALSITIRAAMAARKRDARHSTRVKWLDGEADNGGIEHSLPSDELQSERRRNLVRQLLDELPPEQAETLGMHVVLDIPLKEVARVAGVSVNTIKSRLRLAKHALRKRILSDRPIADALEVAP